MYISEDLRTVALFKISDILTWQVLQNGKQSVSTFLVPKLTYRSSHVYAISGPLKIGNRESEKLPEY